MEPLVSRIIIGARDATHTGGWWCYRMCRGLILYITIRKSTVMLMNGGLLRCGYPQIIKFTGIFHYKPSILGYPFMETTKCVSMPSSAIPTKTWLYFCHHPHSEAGYTPFHQPRLPQLGDKFMRSFMFPSFTLSSSIIPQLYIHILYIYKKIYIHIQYIYIQYIYIYIYTIYIYTIYIYIHIYIYNIYTYVYIQYI